MLFFRMGCYHFFQGNCKCVYFKT
uniref:Uncharacterized protein n=1 Tax=Anguilla anguilla TaxID=7936 RepID=A0A0E9PZ51_ANGAN